MEKLKYEERNVKVVDYDDWDQFIQKVYGIEDYSIVADQEMNNDECREYRVANQELLDKYDSHELEKFKRGENVNYMTRVLMADLCIRGLLEEGTYLIKVCW